MKKKRRLKKILLASLVVCALLIGAFFLYVGTYYHADETALASMTDTSTVSVTYEDDHIVFRPKEATQTGVIFYPGGKVEEEAYAPLCKMIAESGYTCVLVSMPFRLAVLDYDAAEDIMDEYEEIKDWYLAGHSLGGAFGATFASKHSDQLEGLILLGAYSTSDLTQTNLNVLSIYGSEDNVLNKSKYETYQSNLPADATELIIEGGNHAYYGNYGEQSGDGVASISREEQQQKTVQAIIELMN